MTLSGCMHLAPHISQDDERWKKASYRLEQVKPFSFFHQQTKLATAKAYKQVKREEWNVMLEWNRNRMDFYTAVSSSSNQPVSSYFSPFFHTTAYCLAQTQQLNIMLDAPTERLTTLPFCAHNNFIWFGYLLSSKLVVFLSHK